MATTTSVRNVLLPKLAGITDIKLAGLADSPETALKMLVQEHPDVVVFDMDFGGEKVGLDTARLMQKTRTRAAIVMLVPDLDPDEMRRFARRFGTSWSYVKKTTAARVDILETVLRSAARGVQWIEPELSRPLAVIWKIAEQARELEAARAAEAPIPRVAGTKVRSAGYAEEKPLNVEAPESIEAAFEVDPEDEDDIAPGIKTKSTNEADVDDPNITSVQVGHGGIGQNVGKVRRVS